MWVQSPLAFTMLDKVIATQFRSGILLVNTVTVLERIPASADRPMQGFTLPFDFLLLYLVH
jgi:hypothetical protein